MYFSAEKGGKMEYALIVVRATHTDIPTLSLSRYMDRLQFPNNIKLGVPMGLM